MPVGRPILIVEDDDETRSMLTERLEADGEFAVLAAGTLEEAHRMLRNGDLRVDAVILDLGMPDGDGREFCIRMRRERHNMPVLMLTGSDSEWDVVRGLDSGANDYIAKPFRANELFARLRAQLRIFEHSEDAVVSVGPYAFRPAARQLWDRGKSRRILLTSKESAILRLLHRAEGASVDRQRLLQQVWGYNPAVTTHTLETHVYRLRQKIESDPAHPTLLITERQGYRLEVGLPPSKVEDHGLSLEAG
jgi:DNA-binding response OmpR family regulator